jgi:hypothetical protein
MRRSIFGAVIRAELAAKSAAQNAPERVDDVVDMKTVVGPRR